tara:strand:+ start:654 stop:1643 length:990 start_codon:yes stop_codon:yes gene_type:complete
MIKIIVISDFWTPSEAMNAFNNVFMRGNDNYSEYIEFVDKYPFTHVILLNSVMPAMSDQIPKSNVLGIANEPIDFLNIDDNFINYVQKHCKNYIVGKKLKHYPDEFVSYYPFLCHPWQRESYFHGITPNKKYFMSMPYSGKDILPGHKYRKKLINAILKTDLDIHIWGRGCDTLDIKDDKRLMGEFKETHGKIIFEYEFIIHTENSESDDYISDKLPSCIAYNTIPIYWGAKNVEKYFGDKCCIRLSGDIDKDMELLTNIHNNKDKYRYNLNNARKELFEGNAYFMKFLYDYWVLNKNMFGLKNEIKDEINKNNDVIDDEIENILNQYL